ncbi:MAG: restriction endonuclease [Myxococcales bacterium]
MPLTEGRPAERGPGASRLMAQAAEHRRQMLRLVRRRLGDMDAAGFERAALALLEAKGFREIKVAKRGKEGPLVMARRKDGLTDLRWVIQLLKGGAEVGREDIDDLRKDLAHFGAQLGIILSPADVTRDARHDASAGAQVPVLLWCADALSDLYAEAKLGLMSLSVEVLDLDEAFFRQCREKGREDERTRRAREERERAQAPGPQALAGAGAAAPNATAAGTAQSAAQATSPAPSASLPVPTEAERAMLAAAIVTGPSAGDREAAEARRREEEKLRAEAHEKIEAAELQARAHKAAPAPA